MMEFRGMYTIGEFSRTTGLTVKTLRFYHEQGVLIPSRIDDVSGYRYYSESLVDRARIIGKLRDLGFSIKVIDVILSKHDDEADILDFLENRRVEVEQELDQKREIRSSINQIIEKEREARDVMNSASFEIEEKQLDETLIAGFRMQGKYAECGKGFSKVCRKYGRYMAGKPLILCYDEEFKEDGADFETCVPVKKEVQKEGIDVRRIPGGKAICLLHRGPYENISRSYAKLYEYAKANDFEVIRPTREVYLKGPGMIFKGNPKRYLTEIQMLVA